MPANAMNGDVASKIRIEPAAPIIRTKQAAKEVNGQHVEVLVMGYSDRIMIHVTTEGKLGQLVAPFHFAYFDQKISISLSNPLPSNDYMDGDGEDGEMEETPSHLNPRFLLGSANDARGEIAQLYAVQIASLVVRQSPDERRMLLVGIGLKGKLASDYDSEEARTLINEVVGMVDTCRIW